MRTAQLLTNCSLCTRPILLKNETLRAMSFAAFAFVLVALGQAEEPVQRMVLINADSNYAVGRKTFVPSDFGIEDPQATWSIHTDVLRGGKQDGVHLITVETGAMTLRVIPTRGMSVLDVNVDGTRFGWDSPVREVVHPQYVDLDTRGGLGWLEGFNELVVRCGLEFAGHPGVDKFTTNTGETSEMMLTLHGKIGNIPASTVEAFVETKSPYRIALRGSVHERMFFGPKLELQTELSTAPGSTSFTISDRVVNHGSAAQEVMLIYHTNYGTPLLEEGATLVAPMKSLRPMNESAVDGLDSVSVYDAPTSGAIEHVFLTELYDRDGQTQVCLHNAAKDRAASIEYSVEQLPYFTIWKNTAAIEDGYVTGLEPGTCYPFNRSVEREAGRVLQLGPEESRTFTLTYGMHVGNEAVNDVLSNIQSIQDGRSPQVNRQPPTVE